MWCKSLVQLNGSLVASSMVVSMLDIPLKLDIGNPPVAIPTCPLQIYDNDAGKEAQICIEQDGTGDVALEFLLTGDSTYMVGIDNTADGNPFKVAYAAAGGPPVFGTDDILVIDQSNDNVALGLNALDVCAGDDNIAIGNNAALLLSTGTSTIAIGRDAVAAATIAVSNMGIGINALLNNTDGTLNIGIGNDALEDNLTGVENVAMGVQSSESTLGSNNVSLGHRTSQMQEGSENTSVGSDALSGAGFTGTADGNTAVGFRAVRSNTTGITNTGVGHQSLTRNTTADGNTAVGHSALFLALPTGGGESEENTAVGNSALSALTVGSNNTALGSSAGNALTTESDSIVIGNTGGAVIGDGEVHIGTDGTHTSCFVAGVDVATVGAPVVGNVVKINPATEQLATDGPMQLNGPLFSTLPGATPGATLAEADSGTWFTVDATGGVAFTIPDAPSGGISYKFVYGTAGGGTDDVTIETTTPLAVLAGNRLDGTPTVETLSGVSTITFVDGAAVVGDSVELYSLDGSGPVWFFKIFSDAAGGVTAA